MTPIITGPRNGEQAKRGQEPLFKAPSMKSLESSPAGRIFPRFCSNSPPGADDDHLGGAADPPHSRSSCAVDRSQAHVTGFNRLPGRRQREASGVQGAAMGPLVAGTTPATSGMEALGPCRSRRRDPPIVAEQYRSSHMLPRHLARALGVARPSRDRSRLIPVASTSRPSAIPHELQRLAASR
jgi:hypothetical protein